MKTFKKILTILLIFLIITGCSVKKEETVKKTEGNTASYYLELLENFEVKKKNKNNTEDNEEFVKFEDEVFKTFMSMNYLMMNASILDYKALGIKKPETKIFDLKYGNTAYAEKYKEILNQLEEFDYDSLSYRQQYDYDYMRYDLIQGIAGEYFSIYEQPLNISNDLIGNTITNLVEFHFNDKESVDDFIELLNSFPDCMNDVIEYIKIQNENGIGLTDTVIDYNVDLINSFINKITENQMVVSFNQKIDEANFDIDKDAYKKKVKNTIVDVVIPALKKVRDEIKTYKGTTDESSVLLCNINKDFAKYKFYVSTSTNEDPEKFYEELKQLVIKETQEAENGVKNDEALAIYKDILINGLKILDKPYEEVLVYLKENSKKAYPDIGDIPYNIYKLDSTIQDNVLAYYVPMPVDNIDINTIKVNGANVVDGSVDLYTTLAHEGIPGHLYQFYYYAKTNPSKYRLSGYPTAYVEGHTVTAQREALNWLGIDNQDVINILKYDTTNYFFSNSMIDIGLHYFGWNLNDMKKMLDDTGSEYYEEGVAEVYKYLVGCPGMYLSYGGGALNFYKLRKHAEEELKDKFDLVKFNEAMLRNGPLPYPILKYAIDEYIEENK